METEIKTKKIKSLKIWNIILVSCMAVFALLCLFIFYKIFKCGKESEDKTFGGVGFCAVNYYYFPNELFK